VPDDYYERVDSAALPFRIRVICPSTDEQEKNHVERKWHEELVRRGLFVPLDPRNAYPFPADMTLRVRESTLYLFTYPWTKVDAEVWVRERHVRTYRIAAQRIEKPLLYEIYGDSELYRSLLRVPEEDRLAVEERFGQLRRNPRAAGSICLEFEIDQRGSHWDQDMIRSFLEFLKGLEFWEDLHVYPRGHPPPATGAERLFLRADPEFHHPVLNRRWNFVGPGPDWSAWNSAWILVERDHFFRKMTLDLLDALQEPVHLKEDSASRDPAGTGGRTRPIWTAP